MFDRPFAFPVTDTLDEYSRMDQWMIGRDAGFLPTFTVAAAIQLPGSPIYSSDLTTLLRHSPYTMSRLAPFKIHIGSRPAEVSDAIIRTLALPISADHWRQLRQLPIPTPPPAPPLDRDSAFTDETHGSFCESWCLVQDEDFEIAARSQREQTLIIARDGKTPQAVSKCYPVIVASSWAHFYSQIAMNPSRFGISLSPEIWLRDLAAPNFSEGFRRQYPPFGLPA